MKRFVLIIFMALAGVSGFAQSGTCGENLTWVLENGTLTIRGTGAIPDYSGYFPLPWYPYMGDITAVVVESGVESIGAWAFGGCNDVEYITLPASVTAIGGYAFPRSKLLDITVDPDNPAYSSEDGVLFDKDKTMLIQYPNMKGWSYAIPESVISIESYAFAYCRLGYITIPESVTTIEATAFLNCHRLMSIAIPESVTSIGMYAFAECSSLADVTLSASITSIGDAVFRGCSKLTSIVIPEKVTSIESFAFAECSSLADVTVNWTGTPPAISGNVFEALTLSGIKLHVPDGTKAMYEAAEVWKEFNIVEYPVGIPTVSQVVGWKAYVDNGVLRVSGLAAGEVVSVYDVSGKRVYRGVAARVPLAVRGVYIVRTETRSVRVVY
jgi:hypothetical protein